MKANYFYLMKAIIESENSDNIPDLGKFSNKQIMKLLKAAFSNRVLFLLGKKVKQYGYLGINSKLYYLIDKIAAKGEEINRKYAFLLGKVKEKFGENDIPFLVVKTDRKVDYIFSDLDILVEEQKFSKAQELLLEMAAGENTCGNEERWHYTFGRQIGIDAHKMGTDWYSDNFLDVASIWNDTEERQFLGGIYCFPSEQNEWIFNALNIIYERYTVTYLDLLYFKKSRNINYSEIKKIAQKHCWNNGLQTLGKYLEKIKGPVNLNAGSQKIKLPLMFSSIDFLKIFFTRLFRFPKETRLSLYFFLYYFYCKLRYWLSGGHRISFVGKWIDI